MRGGRNPGVSGGAGGAMSWRGEWAPGAYAVNDVVTHDGGLYVTTQAIAAAADSYVGSATTYAASGVSVPINLPAGAAAGDYSVLFYCMGDGYTPVIPTGYGQVVYERTASSSYLAVNIAAKVLITADISAGHITVPAPPTGTHISVQVFRGPTGIDTGRLAATTTGISAPITPAAPSFVVYLGCGYGTGGVSDLPVGLGERVGSSGTGSPLPQSLCGYDVVTTISPAHTFTYTEAAYAAQQLTVAFPLTSGAFPSASFTQLATI